ncbi:MAG: nucleoside diphosphate kinase regulator [Sphingomonadales bacterium]
MTLNDTLPPIIIAETDFDYLVNLASARRGGPSEVLTFLAQELDRADVVPDCYLPLDAVRLGSRVAYRDLTAGNERTVMLVYPREEDIDLGRISVAAPVGAALIGLREGQRIAWRSRAGSERALEVLRVEPG